MHRSRARTYATALVAAMLVTACDGPAAAPPKAKAAEGAPIAVAIAKVGTSDLPRTLRAHGSTRAEEAGEVTVAAVVPGRVVEVLRSASTDTPVAVGELLARIDDEDFALDRDARRRALAESLARLGLETIPAPDVAKLLGSIAAGGSGTSLAALAARPEELARALGQPETLIASAPAVLLELVQALKANADALPAIRRALTVVDHTLERHARAKSLRERNVMSQEEFDVQRNALEIARLDLDIARVAARALLAEVHSRIVALDVADKRVRDARHVVPAGTRPRGAVDAPDSYLVADRYVSPGDYVRVGDRLFRLVDTDPLEVRVAIPERRMEAVAVGAIVRVSLAASRVPLEGRVVRIRPEIDPATRTVAVEVAIPNPGLRLKPGAFATVELEVGSDKNVPVVPSSAVTTFAGVRKVFAVVDGKVVERLVQLGRKAGDQVEVTSGLKAGDAYIPNPPAGLVAGALVRADGS